MIVLSSIRHTQSIDRVNKLVKYKKNIEFGAIVISNEFPSSTYISNGDTTIIERINFTTFPSVYMLDVSSKGNSIFFMIVT